MTKNVEKKIEQFYLEHVLRNLQKLDVQNIRPRDIAKMDRRIKDTGSDQPRAILAYDLAFLSTIEKFSSSIMAPIVIDSPNQQDQDAKNAKAMISLIFSELPENGQLILGTVSLHGEKVAGKLIRLNDKLRLLKKQNYKSVDAEMTPYLSEMF